MHTLIFFFKAEQFGLFDAPVNVRGHATKRGTFVAPYSATRKKRLQQETGGPGDLFADPAGEPVQREPHEIRRQDYVIAELKKPGQSPKYRGFHENEHERSVQRALEAGKKVPQEVLRDYPHVVAKVRKQKEVDALEQAQAKSTDEKKPEAAGKPVSELREKEFWEMPQDEFLRTAIDDGSLKATGAGSIVEAMLSLDKWKRQHGNSWLGIPDDALLVDGYLSSHRRRIEIALSQGKPVPPEVLADYPDLKPKAEDAEKPEDTETKSKATAIKLVQMERAHLTGKAAEALPWDEADIDAVKNLLKYRKKDRKDLVKIYERQLRADPRKFSPGDAVRWLPVKGQINRGYRVLQVFPNSKLAVIQPYRDTGHADFEYEGYKKQTVHVGDLQHEGGRAKPEKKLNATSKDEVPRETAINTRAVQMIQAMSKLIHDRHGQEKVRSSLKRKKEMESAYVSMRYSASKLGIEVPDVGTFYQPDRYLEAAQAAVAGLPKWASKLGKSHHPRILFFKASTYSMPRSEAVEEHRRLVRVLRSPSHADDLEEAKEQAGELAAIERKGKRKKKKADGETRGVL